MSEQPSEGSTEPSSHPIEKAGMAIGRGVPSGTERVERGLNEMRLAVLGILVTIGLTVGFGVAGAWWCRVLWGVGVFALSCLLIRWGWSRNLMMRLMHHVTGH